MKGLHQIGFPADILQLMAIRAALVFGGFVFHQPAIFIINMATDIAFFYFGELIVCILSPKDII